MYAQTEKPCCLIKTSLSRVQGFLPSSDLSQSVQPGWSPPRLCLRFCVGIIALQGLRLRSRQSFRRCGKFSDKKGRDLPVYLGKGAPKVLVCGTRSVGVRCVPRWGQISAPEVLPWPVMLSEDEWHILGRGAGALGASRMPLGAGLGSASRSGAEGSGRAWISVWDSYKGAWASRQASSDFWGQN